MFFMSITGVNHIIPGFNSLQQLNLPPIELFNDAAIQQEFLEITKKLK